MNVEITWQGVFWFILFLVILSFIAGFIDAAWEQRKRRLEQEERERFQRRFDKGNT